MAVCHMLNYPLLVSKLIFEFFEPGQLFELSRLSKRTEAKIKDSGVRCKKHYVSFTNQPSICLNFTEEKKLEILFNIPFPKTTQIRSAWFKDFHFSYGMVSDNLMYVCPGTTSVFGGLYHFYDYIAGIFSTKMIGQLDVDVDKIKNLIGLLAIPEFSHCETLQLIGGEMEDEDAKYIQEQCQINDTLILNGKVGGREQNWKMLEVKNLVIKSNDWVNVNDLMLMKCENIYIDESSTIKIEDLIKFVLSWKEGYSNHRLKTLQLNYTGPPSFKRYKPLPLPKYPELQSADVLDDDSDSDDSDSDEEIIIQRQRREAEIERHIEDLEDIVNKNDNALQLLEASTPWKEIERKKVNFERHLRTYTRGEKTFSKHCGEPDVYEIDGFYRNVEMYNGTLASIYIMKNTFRMLVWHEFELPP